ncbi:MAG: hypothetical protein LBC41_14125, partial [Clostridiales bacterium]|nr:hypothetical protein [Clostridiales bacterium]
AFDASTETGANNDLQFAVFALNLEDASTGSSVNNELVAYGVQDLQTAVSDFFAADVWTKFHP